MSTKSILKDVGTELKDNPPAILSHTAEKFGPARAAKQRVAILLNKGRRMGASIPKAPQTKYKRRSTK